MFDCVGGGIYNKAPADVGADLAGKVCWFLVCVLDWLFCCGLFWFVFVFCASDVGCNCCWNGVFVFVLFCFWIGLLLWLVLVCFCFCTTDVGGNICWNGVFVLVLFCFGLVFLLWLVLVCVVFVQLMWVVTCVGMENKNNLLIFFIILNYIFFGN